MSTYLLTGSDVRLAKHVVACNVAIVQNTFVPHSCRARALLMNLRVRWVGKIGAMTSPTRACSTRDAAGARVDRTREVFGRRAGTEAGRSTSAPSSIKIAWLVRLLPAGLYASRLTCHSIGSRAGKPCGFQTFKFLMKSLVLQHNVLQHLPRLTSKIVLRCRLFRLVTRLLEFDGKTLPVQNGIPLRINPRLDLFIPFQTKVRSVKPKFFLLLVLLPLCITLGRRMRREVQVVGVEGLDVVSATGHGGSGG